MIWSIWLTIEKIRGSFDVVQPVRSLSHSLITRLIAPYKCTFQTNSNITQLRCVAN